MVFFACRLMSALDLTPVVHLSPWSVLVEGTVVVDPGPDRSYSSGTFTTLERTSGGHGCC